MSGSYTPTVLRHTAISIIGGADHPSAGGINLPIEEVADNVEAVANGLEFFGAKTRTIHPATGRPNVDPSGIPTFALASLVSDVAIIQRDITTVFAELWFPLPVPVGRKITGARVELAGTWSATTHSALPTTLPKIRLWKKAAGAAGMTAIGTAVNDGSATVGAYNAFHTITKTGLAEVTVTQTQYWLQLVGETGTNAVANALAVHGAYVTEVDP